GDPLPTRQAQHLVGKARRGEASCPCEVAPPDQPRGRWNLRPCLRPGRRGTERIRKLEPPGRVRGGRTTPASRAFGCAPPSQKWRWRMTESDAKGRSPGRRRAAGIYGTIVTAAVLAASGNTLSSAALEVTVVVTLVVYWLAEQYAELLGEHTHAG